MDARSRSSPRTRTSARSPWWTSAPPERHADRDPRLGLPAGRLSPLLAGRLLPLLAGRRIRDVRRTAGPRGDPTVPWEVCHVRIRSPREPKGTSGARTALRANRGQGDYRGVDLPMCRRRGDAVASVTDPSSAARRLRAPEVPFACSSRSAPHRCPAPRSRSPVVPSPSSPRAPHFVNGRSMFPPYPDGLEIAEFALGCFWGEEKAFWQIPGVWVTAVGYQGGTTPEPDVPRGRAPAGPGTPRRCASCSIRRSSRTSGCSSRSGSSTTRPRACARATTSARSTARRSSPTTPASVPRPLASTRRLPGAS